MNSKDNLITELHIQLIEKEQKINKLQQENKQLKERFERLKQEHIDTITRNEEKQQRIDKAIEYINENTYLGDGEYTNHCDMLSRNELLEILGDKENDN